jgi:hypothetical protein
VTGTSYLEVMMTMIRLLLPFTHGIDVSAITAALALAERFLCHIGGPVTDPSFKAKAF